MLLRSCTIKVFVLCVLSSHLVTEAALVRAHILASIAVFIGGWTVLEVGASTEMR
jgi:hypothetical protein